VDCSSVCGSDILLTVCAHCQVGDVRALVAKDWKICVCVFESFYNVYSIVPFVLFNNNNNTYIHTYIHTGDIVKTNTENNILLYLVML